MDAYFGYAAGRCPRRNLQAEASITGRFMRLSLIGYDGLKVTEAVLTDVTAGLSDWW
jgi:hypothetical protein